MNLLWPWALALLLLIPALVAGYIWLLRRKRKYTVRYSSLSLVRAAMPKHSRWRRHLPFALLLLALASLTTAMARPMAQVQVPLSQTSIILALDASRSMCAVDVEPNRLTVAQEAALSFIEDQPAGARIGIVAFGGLAEIIVPPTDNKEILQEAVAGLTTSLGTAIGSATLKSIDAIAEVSPEVPPSGVVVPSADAGTGESPSVLRSDIIVLLTDGANTQGPRPLDAAQEAADRGLRVYTIGFGTADPGPMICNRRQMGSSMLGGDFGRFSGGMGGGDFRRYLVIDEPTLQGVADLTGGAYFRAESAEQLLEIFYSLPSKVVQQKRVIEISVLFSAIGGLLAILAIGLAFRWNRYP